MRLLAAFLVVSAALAGCSSGDGGDPEPTPGLDPPSEKRFDILEPEAVWVASAQDGKRLFNAVYRPDTDEPVPVFINFSPYWADSAMAMGDPFAHYMVEEYVPRGYAVVLSAVRGTGHSEGCFQIAGDLELQDAYDVVEHFAAEPWSSGNVAAGGKSYDSTTQNGLVAKFPPPSLKGIFHVSGITDMYRYNYREGVPYESGLAFTPRYYLAEGLDEYGLPFPIVGGTGSSDDEDAESLARLVDDAACVELPEHLVSAEGAAVHGMKDAYWQERDWNRYLPESSWNGSVFFVHGLQDWNVKPDHILPWLEIVQQKGLPVLGWLHQDTFNDGHVYPMRADWNETMLAWLDWTLKGHRNGFEDRLGYEVEGTDGVWRAHEVWPAATPSLVGKRLWTANSHYSGREAGELYIVDTLPLGNDPLLLRGAASFNVSVTARHQDAVATVTLWDEEGTRRTWVGEGVLRLVLRDGLDAPVPYTPGEAVAVTIETYPVAHAVLPGHSLVATFGDVPRHALLTPGQGDVSYDLASGATAASLGVEGAGADSDPLDPQPVDTPCWAC